MDIKKYVAYLMSSPMGSSCVKASSDKGTKFIMSYTSWRKDS
jgi:hypothetical protein